MTEAGRPTRKIGVVQQLGFAAAFMMLGTGFLGISGNPGVAFTSAVALLVLAKFAFFPYSLSNIKHRCLVWLFYWLVASTIQFVQHRWVGDISAAGVVPLALYLGMYPTLYLIFVGYVFRDQSHHLDWNNDSSRTTLFITKMFFGASIIWVALEVIRGELVWGGYAFSLLGHHLIDVPYLQQSGSAVGQYGASLAIMALVAALLLSTAPIARMKVFRDRQSAGGLIPAARQVAKPLAIIWAVSAMGVVFLFIVGPYFVSGRQSEEPKLVEDRFIVLQTNVPQDNREDWQTPSRLETLSFIEDAVLEAVEEYENIRAIVIPETMFPGRFGLEPSAVTELREWGLVLDDIPMVLFHDRLADLQAEVGIPFVVGATAYDGLRFEVGDDGGIRPEWDAVYNSVYVIAEGEVQPERFDKVHLTPFGEVMPLISRWEWLEQQLLAIGARGMTFELDQGRTHNTLAIGKAGDTEALRFAAPICFEATDQSTVRDLVFGRNENDELVRKADFIINGTNDGWFGDDDRARRGHLMASRWRALELRTPMIRAANTGVSAIIDAKGRIVAEAPAREWATLVGRVPQAEGGPTLYARTGNVVGWGCVVATAVMMALALVRRKGDRAEEEKIGEDAGETPNTGAESA